MGVRGFSSPLEHSSSVRRDVPLEINRAIPDIVDERTSSLRNVDGLLGEESNMLYVDGLPNDCLRREAAHLFRPFIGFKDIRVIHKEARRDRDKAQVFCFVEFADPKCALTAMEALQGYKFDDKKPDAPVLKIQFAKFPFRPPSNRDEQHRGDLH
ncbi:hypothetical protein Syun_026457 [Stephania yunnanensis]|uniref:RRM domain-containing protein n=1 Tax=Stephania yunnanensis TaxID=152371 RepID=A0AAP0EWE1_9MAGN